MHTQETKGKRNCRKIKFWRIKVLNILLTYVVNFKG